MAIDWKYAAIAAAASVGVGILAGTLVEVISSRMEAEDDCEDEYLPDIPEGINEEYVEIPVDDLDYEPKGRPSTDKPSLKELIDYGKYYTVDEQPVEVGAEEIPAVRVISSEEFVKATGNLDGYVTVTGTWFADDGVLAGWDDELESKKVSETIGKAAVMEFDDPEVDAVYVRNDLLKVLYEIVRGEGSYEAAVEELGYPDGDE